MKFIRINELKDYLEITHDDVEYIRRKRNGTYEIEKNGYSSIEDFVKSLNNLIHDVQFCDLYFDGYELYTFNGVGIDITKQINGEEE